MGTVIDSEVAGSLNEVMVGGVVSEPPPEIVMVTDALRLVETLIAASLAHA